MILAPGQKVSPARRAMHVPRCPLCRRPLRSPLRQRYAPRWRSLVPAVNMASGDVLLDVGGNRILDADGNTMLDDGAGNSCCCCPCTPSASSCTDCGTDTTPSTYRAVISGTTPACAANPACPSILLGSALFDGNISVLLTQVPGSPCAWKYQEISTTPTVNGLISVHVDCDCLVSCEDNCPPAADRCIQLQVTVTLTKNGDGTFTLKVEFIWRRCNPEFVGINSSITFYGTSAVVGCCEEFTINNGTRVANTNHSWTNPPNGGVGGIATITPCPSEWP